VLVESIAVKQLVDYLETNELMSQLQSAYRRHHSTETALLKVMSDVLTAAANSQNVTLLALLDLRSVFDCVDHYILLSRLQSIPLDWEALCWRGSVHFSRTGSSKC